MTAYPTVDLALARRLERAEARANIAFVESRRTLQPRVGADWTEVAGVHAMFDGPDSPLTQTFGLGLFDPVLAPELDALESFFASRGAPTSHEVCSLAAPETIALLGGRGYAPIEASTVLVRPTSAELAPPAPPAGAIAVRPVGEDESPVWVRTATEGWGAESAELGAFVESMGALMARARGVVCFLAEMDGAPVAAAAMNVHEGIALLAGATTVPAARRQGAQAALFQTRLAYAAERGVDLAMVVAAPGSSSQRNAMRRGFRPVYTRAKWQRGVVW